MNAILAYSEAIKKVDSGEITIEEYERLINVLWDVEPVVRCRDCIRYRPDGNVWGRCTMAANPMRKKDFCSYGVRKDGDHETD